MTALLTENIKLNSKLFFYLKLLGVICFFQNLAISDVYSTILIEKKTQKNYNYYQISKNLHSTQNISLAIDNKDNNRTSTSLGNGSYRLPRVAIVIYGLGTSASATRTAIQELPGQITLAFWPHSKKTDNWVAAAHAAGHETLMMVSIEPQRQNEFYLHRRITKEIFDISEFRNRLDWILGLGKSHVGVISVIGSYLTKSPPHMQVVFTELKKRNLLFLDQSSGNTAIINVKKDSAIISLKYNSLNLDQRASRTAIDKKLTEIERIAINKGQIIVMGFPYPVTFERLKHWINKLEKKHIALVPISHFLMKLNREQHEKK